MLAESTKAGEGGVVVHLCSCRLGAPAAQELSKFEVGKVYKVRDIVMV